MSGRGVSWIMKMHGDAGRDLRYALRSLRRAPMFAATAIAIIALATGAVTTVFAFVNAVLLEPLPFRDPQRLALVWAIDAEGSRVWLSPPELEEIREQVPAFTSVAGMTDLRVVLTGAGDPEELDAAGGSAGIFDLLGVRMQFGRGLDASDDRSNAPPVAVLSDGLWRRRFGARPDILGSAVTLDRRPYTVVGILPRSFELPPPSSVFPSTVDVWVALQPHLAGRGRDIRLLHVIGRTADGRSLADVRGALDAFGRQIAAPEPHTFTAVALHDDLVRGVRPALVVLFATVGVVLFIACANVAALLLARSTARQREFGVRAALGATRARLAQQLLIEGIVLAALGGGLGLALAALAPAAARVPALAAIPRLGDAAIDWRVALFAMGVSCATAILFTLAPVVASLRGAEAHGMLIAGSRGHTGIRGGTWLAAAQIALACTVLVVALLLARTLGVLLQADLGFSVEGVATMRVSLPPAYGSAGEVTRFFDRAVERLGEMPGVHSVAAITQLPLSGAALGSSFIEGSTGDGGRLDADLRGVTPQYFSAMGISLIEGRGFASSDRAETLGVAIVDEAFARRMWPGRSPIGQTMRWFRQPERTLEVVGVVRSVRHKGFDAPPRETVYRPHAQYARSTMYVVLRTTGRPDALAAPAAAAIHEIDPGQPVADVATMKALSARSLAQPAFGAGLAAVLALLALVLTTAGTYGLFAYAVTLRRREIGIRLALGATRRRIVGTIAREGFTLAALGLAAGMPAAFFAVRLARGFMSHLAGADLLTLLVAAGAVAASTGAACWLPARRAARIPPGEALRAE